MHGTNDGKPVILDPDGKLRVPYGGRKVKVIPAPGNVGGYPVFLHRGHDDVNPIPVLGPYPIALEESYGEFIVDPKVDAASKDAWTVMTCEATEDFPGGAIDARTGGLLTLPAGAGTLAMIFENPEAWRATGGLPTSVKRLYVSGDRLVTTRPVPMDVSRYRNVLAFMEVIGSQGNTAVNASVTPLELVIERAAHPLMTLALDAPEKSGNLVASSIGAVAISTEGAPFVRVYLETSAEDGFSTWNMDDPDYEGAALAQRLVVVAW